jgi:hypothetical protein
MPHMQEDDGAKRQGNASDASSHQVSLCICITIYGGPAHHYQFFAVGVFVDSVPWDFVHRRNIVRQ